MTVTPSTASMRDVDHHGMSPTMAAAVFDDRVRRFGHLLETFTKFERAIDRSLRESVGLAHAWFEVLERIASAPNQQLTMTELGRRLALTSGGVTRFLDGIVDAGYITRTKSPSDGRATLARLTDTGWAILADALTVHTATIEELLAPLTETERNALDHALLKLL
jgi:DNA-binding MarR family transcriptional regulator